MWRPVLLAVSVGSWRRMPVLTVRPLHHPSRSLCYSPHHPFGSGGTIYNDHALEPFKKLGLDSQRAKKLDSKLHVHSVNYAARLVHTRRALSSTIINSHHEPVPGQPATLLIPIDFFYCGGLTVPSTKMASFLWLMWGVVFTACVFFFCSPWSIALRGCTQALCKYKCTRLLLASCAVVMAKGHWHNIFGW